MTTALLALIISGTVITLQPTDHPGAQAEITMHNEMMNDERDNGEHVMNLGDLSVWVEFAWNHDLLGNDAIVVTPPDGMICKPLSCVLVVEEGHSGTMYLMPWEGM